MTEPVRSETEIEVRYAETDQMGVVYYANYLVWFEVARADRRRGADRLEQLRRGLGSQRFESCRNIHPVSMYVFTGIYHIADVNTDA